MKRASPGTTVPMWAADSGDLEIAKVLLDKGAHVNAKDNNGRTALLWAATKGHFGVVKLFWRTASTLG